MAPTIDTEMINSNAHREKTMADRIKDVWNNCKKNMSLLSRRLRWSRLTSTTNYAVRSYFIKTETTPNPESMKFLPDTTVLPAEYGTGMVALPSSLSY
jgi:hypothetical protein